MTLIMTVLTEKLSVYINARFILHLTIINKNFITVVEMLSQTDLMSWRKPYINMVEKRRGKDMEIPTLLNILHYLNSMTHLYNSANTEVVNVSINELQEQIFLYIFIRIPCDI
jgi:hypothetical protein